MHVPPDHAPLRLAEGETVRVGDVDRVWPEFVFVLATHGVGWVPSRNLSASRPTATVLVAYDTQELAVYAGATVDLLQRDPGSAWAWCRASDGREGWLPTDSLEDLLEPVSTPRPA